MYMYTYTFFSGGFEFRHCGVSAAGMSVTLVCHSPTCGWVIEESAQGHLTQKKMPTPRGTP